MRRMKQQGKEEVEEFPVVRCDLTATHIYEGVSGSHTRLGPGLTAFAFICRFNCYNVRVAGWLCNSTQSL